MSTAPSGGVPRTSGGARPRVLALPSPTISRFVLLAVALLSSGLFVGSWFHSQTSVGTDWVQRIGECEARRPPVSVDSDPVDVLLSEQWVLACVQGVQEGLAWFALAGVGVTLLCGIAVVWSMPRIIRRRRKLRATGPRLAAVTSRVEAFAREAGLRSAPEVVIGPSKLRDAFSLGVPGRYAVALPPALAVRSSSPAFELMVRHELAHVARHDVVLAWSARALWYVVAGLLLLPVLSALVRMDLSLLPSYLWRAALLMLATLLAAAGVLRSREYDADLVAGEDEPRREVLRTLLRTSSRPRADGWRRVFALHPDPDERVMVLDDPARLARASWIEAGLAAFLAALILPLVVSVFATVPSITTWAYLIPALLVGPLLGATVGLGLWRLALVDTVVGARSTVRAASLRLAGGVVVGYVLGSAATLAEVGRPEAFGALPLTVMLLGGAAMAGATFAVAGLGIISADRAASFSVRGYTLAAILLPGIMFAFVLWAVTTVTQAVDVGGWLIAGPVILLLLNHAAAAVAVLLLAVAVLLILLLRRSPRPAAWAVEGEGEIGAVTSDQPASAATALVSGLVSGVVAALCIVIFRVVAGPAADLGEVSRRFDTDVIVFAAAGAAAAVALIALHGVRAAALALLSAPVASMTAALGFLAMNTALGGPLTLEFVTAVLLAGVPLGALLAVMACLLAAVPVPQAPRHPTLFVIVASALISAALAGGTIAFRDAVDPALGAAADVVPAIAARAPHPTPS